MLELLLEIVLELVGALFEIMGSGIFQLIFEILAEFGCKSLEHSCRPPKQANPFVAGLGLLLLGALAGLVLGLLLPNPLFQRRPVSGLSLVLAPLGIGALMHLFGAWRRKHGGKPTFLASFWGGACFAFGMALVRWLLVQYR